MDYDFLILGGGAAGLMAAIAAAQAHPLRIAILEKNAKPGLKLLVCGGGRCNFTNAGSVEFLIAQFGRNGRFLSPAIHGLSNVGLREFFDSLGVPSHEEHDGKIYPDSNSAKSVVDALLRRCHELGVDIHAGQPVTAVSRELEGFGVATPLASYRARALLIATGGMSYQRMGTTGDGYGFAQALGHSLVTPRPAIVGLLTAEEWPQALQGLAVRDVEVRIELPKGRQLPRLATGKPEPSVNDMLFTHFGLSGPAVLNPSEIVAELLEKLGPGSVAVRIDFVRRLSHEALAALLRSWQQHQGKMPVSRMLAQRGPEITINATSPDQTWAMDAGERAAAEEETVRLPRRLAEALLAQCEIPVALPCAHLSSGHIHRLIERLKSTRLTITGTRGFKEAMVTAGGVTLSEVDPKTMESKLTPNLFLAGEVLDLTGPSGGYNLQLAFSTGRLAGVSAARKLGS